MKRHREIDKLWRSGCGAGPNVTQFFLPFIH